MDPIRIAVAEDNMTAMKAILLKLASDSRIQVKTIAFSGADLMQALERNNEIDIALIDIQMPVMDGIETTRKIKALYPQVNVVMLTAFDDDDKIFASIMAGASGYLLKEESDERIVLALNETMNGGAGMTASIALKALNLIRNPHVVATEKSDFGITKREVELLEQLKEGRTYSQAALAMGISLGTVQRHIGSVYRKLQVNNKVEAVQKAIRNRIV